VKGERPGEIPRNYWAEPIPALKPNAVREHTLSILIVMERTEKTEKGLFFLSSLSSRLPRIMLTGREEGVVGTTEDFFGLTLRRTKTGFEYSYSK
jgi:hypothetical protein